MNTLMHPYVFFAGAAIIAGLLIIARTMSAQILLLASYIVLLASLTWHEFTTLNVIEAQYLKADPLTVTLLSVLTILGAVAAFQGVLYAKHRGDSISHLALHNAALVGFLSMLVGVYLSRHIGLVWAFLEASTLTAAVLIYHNRNRNSVEATWKYVFVCSIGIAIAFAGILFLSIAGSATDAHDLSFEALRAGAHLMDPTWLKISFLFLLAGFSVKLGVVPLFNVDIDAKDAAPSHISALLSSVLMNAGFSAVYRIYSVYSGTSIRPWLNSVLLLCGTLSILAAAVYILKVKNLKRLLAYSSLEHAGIVLIAVGSGAWFAALLHLVLHSFAKSAMFLQYGHYFRLTKSKKINAGGDYLSAHPAGAGVFIVGLLALCAVPPMGTFLSEMLALTTLLGTAWWWWALIIIPLLAVILWAMTKRIVSILYRPRHHTSVNGSRATMSMAMETIPQYALLAVVIWLGFFAPPAVVDFLHRASILHP
ncbi:MAG TPA: proton-conducting transporter membrane subunit [Candidatus Didemnitutus sp.]|nr:proton-conducting transporter membrane subunit [Candidatus Didemnitutus sp.]